MARKKKIVSLTTVLVFTCGMSTAQTSVSVVLTTGDKANLLTPQPSVAFSSGSGSGNYTIEVSPASVSQPWDGVGAALTDSAATVLASLPASQLNPLLQQLFTQNGVGFNIVRVPMGASDIAHRETTVMTTCQPERPTRISPNSRLSMISLQSFPCSKAPLL